MSRRDFNADMAFLQVKINGIHKPSAIMRSMAKINAIGVRSGMATTIAKIEDKNHIQVVQEQAPNSNRVSCRKYLAV